MKRQSSSRRSMRGVAVVEFAILLIPLLTLVMGVAEFGRAIYQYEALTKATRDATRYLSEFSPTDVTYPQTLADAQCLALTGQLTSSTVCSGNPLVPGLKASMVVICDSVNTSTGCSGTYANVPTYDSSGAAAGTINLVEVKIIGFTYTPLETFLNLASITFNNISTVMRQVL